MMKKLLLSAIMAIVAMTPANAQTNNGAAPYVFLGLQGGAQTTFTNYDQMKLITPTASVSLGAFFTPVIGARIQANGLWNKGGLKPDYTYEYKYVTTDLDLLINLSTLFSSKDYYPVNLYLIGGFGINTAWDNKDLRNSTYAAVLPSVWEKHNLSHNARVGLMLDCNLSRHLSVNLELNANSLNDRYNSKTSDKEDWQATAQLGLAYKFGFKKNAHKTESATREQISTAQTLYEQMLARVDENMNTWMKRMKGESKADYLARTTDDAIETQRLEFIKSVSTEMAGNRINTSVKDLQYNKEKELLGVQFKDMPSITLNVSASDVSNIKKPSDVQFINTVYQLKPGDQFEVLYTEALYPVTGKKYTYDSASNAPYNQSDNYVPLSALKTAEKPATAAVSEVAKPTKPVVKPELRTELFYSIRETSIATAEKGKFNQLVKFLKENPDVKVSVVGYADAGTGNDEINDRLAQQRAENVAKALQRAGIAAQRITTDSKGSSIQPYPENDKNRVAIIVAK